MMPYTDNPILDFELHEAQRQRMLDKFPVCTHCGEPITDDHLMDINGELYHLSCAEQEFQKFTEDYID